MQRREENQRRELTAAGEDERPTTVLNDGNPQAAKEPKAFGIAPGLVEFAVDVKQRGGAIAGSTAETVADAFRRYFDIPVPLVAGDITRLLQRIDLRHVFFQRGIEQMYATKGIWIGTYECQRILIESTRPEPSRCKTVLHELIEPLWICEMEMAKLPYTITERERWADRFAAMVKMPPDMFMDRAAELGCDLRSLAHEFIDTLAGVSRQVRDINLSGRFFYFCRFDLANTPEGADANFVTALQSCGGVCVRIVDVAKTFRAKARRYDMSSVPLYNLPGKFQYRILNGEMQRHLQDHEPVYITGYDAASSFNQPYRDLFGMNRIAVLLYRYGTAEKSGFFILAVSEGDPALEPQLDRIKAIRRDDITWLFRYEDFVKPKPDSKLNPNHQRGLPVRDSKGAEKDMSEMEFQWTAI